MDPSTEAWMQNLVDERDGAALYAGLARWEKDPSRAAIFREMADAERRHGSVWERKLTEAGIPLPPFRGSSRVRALIWLARRLGSTAVMPLVIQGESGDAEKYDAQGGDATALAIEERAHRAALTAMSPTGNRPDARAAIMRREKWHGG